MDISSITSELSQQTGYSESELNGLLTKRLDKYQKLAARAEETLAALALGKTINEEEQVLLPAVPVTLGNINVGQALRNLAASDLDKYNARLNELFSGNESKFMEALRDLTKETETTLRGEFEKLETGAAARFTNNLDLLTRVDSEDSDMTEEEVEALSQRGIGNLINVVAKVTGINEKSLTSAVKGVQIYV